MNYRNTAREFVKGMREVGVDVDQAEVAQRMAWLNDAGSARNEVQRWHEEAGHVYAGAHRCPECIASGKWAK